MSERRPGEHRTERFQLESGQVLTNLVQAYHLDGELSSEGDNLVLVFHALTGSADAVGDWWKVLAGPGRPLDTQRYAVLCVNLLGSCYGTRWDGWEDEALPPITTRDMARAVALVVEQIGARSVSLALGGSLGGMVALEWAVSFPGLTRQTISVAAPAAHTASAIAWNSIQRSAIQLAGEAGLGLARQIAMMTYRTGAEMEGRFGRARTGEAFHVERYLRHQGAKLVSRFDARCYVSLLHTMDSHDVGRGRGGLEAALAPAAGRLTGVAIPGDLLYPAGDVLRWTERAGADYQEIQSIHGHDAFLIEHDQVGSIISGALLGPVAPLTR